MMDFRRARFPGHVLRLACGVGMVLAGSAAVGQTAAPRAVVSQEMVVTADGWTIPITYYHSPQGKESPVVVLLHQEKGQRLDWEKSGFPKTLQQAGFAVVVPDLRKHGEARHITERAAAGDLRPPDYKAIASVVPMGDLEAVKRFLLEEHQRGNLNIARTGLVVASDLTAPALIWVEADWAKVPYNDAPTLAASTPRGQDVKAIILLSPRERVSGLSATGPVKALASLPGIAFLILYSENTADARDAERIHETLTMVPGGDRRVYEKKYPGKLRGMDLLSEPLKSQKVDDLMLGFLEKHLKNLAHAPMLNIEWRDRRSRVDR